MKEESNIALTCVKQTLAMSTVPKLCYQQGVKKSCLKRGLHKHGFLKTKNNVMLGKREKPYMGNLLMLLEDG